MLPVRALTGLLLSSFLLATRLAAADAQQCVAENNDGADRRATHHLLGARDAYRACVAEPGCPDVVRSECESVLADLKTAIPTLLVSVLDEQEHDVVGATLKVDGRRVAVDGSPIEVDPGPHVLVAEGQGVNTAVQVVGVENEANRQVALVLKGLNPAQHAPDQESSASGSGFVALTPAPSRVPGYVLGGVGAVALASFGYFAASGHSQDNALERCKPDCTRNAVYDVRVKYALADVSLGVSVVALATAGYFLFRPPHEKPAQSGSVSVDFTAAPAAAGLSLHWVE